MITVGTRAEIETEKNSPKYDEANPTKFNASENTQEQCRQQKFIDLLFFWLLLLYLNVEMEINTT